MINLESSCSGKSLNWKSPAGEWLVTVVYASPKSLSYNPMHPLSGKKYVEYFFQRFEDRFPEDSKGGLNFFFSDELNFQLGNLIWDDYFQSEFKKRKGYDIVPYLSALFVDMGEKTAKYRLDYNGVMVSLSEEHFFEPVYRWHEDRGLIYGCDHGGRGLDVAEFGDYFRTQRWNQGPGCDQPKLSKHIIKNKVASSIAHMYNRPRVWLEGFHSSGWDTSSGKLLDAIFANFVQGQNLLSLHGLYYSTPDGWWEWAPPCNHFRMPYWAEMDKLLACSERLSYLLSQGYHCADVAMLYPVEPVVAGNGRASVDCAFKLGEELYHQGIDFDFMDYESLARAEIKGSELQVAGESFRVLIVPEMETMRSTSIEKAVAFQKAGGTVIWVNRLPNATEKGKADETMQRLVAEQIVTPASLVLSEVNQATKRDFAIVEGNIDEPNVMHRKVGHRDLYAVYHVDKGAKCYFRSLGGAELWNPWTGEVQPLSVCQTDEEGSYIRMPLEKTEMQLIVFDPNKPAKIEDVHPVVPTTTYPISGKWEAELIPVGTTRKDGLTSFEVKGKAGKSPALITMEVESSYPGGAVFPYPIQQHCGKGEIELGDWSRLSGLNCYSGGMWYRKEIELTKEECERALTLDLGDVVSTAELFVNGKSVGLRMAAPWKFDLSGVLKPGKNLFEIRVYNTVATHYLSIPTMYRGEVTSGILGTPQLLMK